LSEPAFLQRYYTSPDRREDTTDGVRRPVSGGDAVRSQVIDVLEAQIKRRLAMKKVSTAATKQSRNISQQKLTIGLDLGIATVGIACWMEPAR
jgi:hypothetical protein